MVQVPRASIVTLLPETEQMPAVLLVKATGKPELAVPVSANGVELKLLLASVAKVIVWAFLATVNERATCGAAVKLAFPPWLASTVHVPAATMVTVLPETVQTLDVLVLKATARPELAVADTVNGVAP